MSVNGERALMRVGDFIITPPIAWHDHGSPGDGPVFWLDKLDIPVLQIQDASFAERLGQDRQPIPRPDGDSDTRYGANLPPGDLRGRHMSRVVNYPHA